jgi:ABC-type phosphate/phosphonate transport system permease subunit
MIYTSDATATNWLTTPTVVTLTTQLVNSVTRRMMMTIKQTLQATLVGLILSVPFLIEIAKELVK